MNPDEILNELVKELCLHCPSLSDELPGCTLAIQQARNSILSYVTREKSEQQSNLYSTLKLRMSSINFNAHPSIVQRDMNDMIDTVFKNT